MHIQQVQPIIAWVGWDGAPLLMNEPAWMVQTHHRGSISTFLRRNSIHSALEILFLLFTSLAVDYSNKSKVCSTMEDVLNANIDVATTTTAGDAIVDDTHANCGNNPPVSSPVAGTNEAIVDVMYPRQVRFEERHPPIFYTEPPKRQHQVDLHGYPTWQIPTR